MAVTSSQINSFVYDVMGRLTQASTGWHDADYAYTIHGEVLSETTLTGATSYLYDAAGRRTRMTWSDNYYVTYDYDTAGALIDILEYGSASLAAFSYDDLGRRTGLTRGNGTETTWRYDGADSKGRLDEVEQNLSGSANDLVFGFGYSPAGQIVSRVSDNDRYDFDELSNITIASLANALNQLTSIGSATPTHDNRGNMTSDGTNSYGYDTYNRMTSAPGSASFIYDPQGRLLQASKTGLSTRRFGYDGAEIIGEYSSSNVLLTRYVRGPAADEVLVEVDASSGSKTYLHHDERGSVIAGSGPTGAQTFINTYDEYGKPGVLNEGSFQYTGQLYLEETEASGSGSGLYYYKARIYNPDLGRFMQTDPIGYGDGLNMYAYVGGDPVNFSDPGGLARFRGGPTNRDGGGGSSGFGLSGSGGFGGGFSDEVFSHQKKRSLSIGDFILQHTIRELQRRGALVDEIIVIGERKSAVTFLGVGLPQTPLPSPFRFGHENFQTNVVCADGSNISDSELAEEFNSFVVPRMQPSPAANGSLNAVTDPRFDFPVSAGFVNTFFSPDGLSGRNQTTFFHALHSGSVTRTVSRTSSGGIAVTTQGTGSNFGLIAAAVNAHQGPRIFDELDRDFARSLQGKFEGCSF